MMNIPYTMDITQIDGKITDVPEIRVWCHPHKVGDTKEDYYHTFETFKDALCFIHKHKEAEEVPLIAFKGYEINIFDLEEEGGGSTIHGNEKTN